MHIWTFINLFLVACTGFILVSICYGKKCGLKWKIGSSGWIDVENKLGGFEEDWKEKLDHREVEGTDSRWRRRTRGQSKRERVRAGD